MPPYQRRNDPELSAAFAKDPADEDFLEGLNLQLAPREEAGYRDLPEELPTLHVVGAPRSGTTLMYQVIVSELGLGYVNNLIASFWLAPTHGIRLARKLGLHEIERSSFESDFGRTPGALEPHEFGYFWNHHLRYPDMRQRGPEHDETIDWANLRRVLINMAAAYGRPMAFKPMLLTWHLPTIAERMPLTRFVWIRREPREVALSLLRMRRSLLGTTEGWTSLRPADISDDLAPWDQVAAQVVAIEASIDAARRAIGDDRFLVVDYARLCAEPGAVVDDVAALLATAGHEAPAREGELPPFSPGGSSAMEAEFGARVDRALETLGAGTAPQGAGR